MVVIETNKQNGKLGENVLFLTAVILIGLLSTCYAQAPAPRRDILFVGNSLTYYHQMPQTLQQLILAGGDSSIRISQSTFPGLSLQQHCQLIPENGEWRAARVGETPPSLKRIREGDFAQVILQDGTMNLLIPQAKEYFVKPYVDTLTQLIRSRGGQPVLYQAYPLGNYPQQYCYPCILISRDIESDACCSPTFTQERQEFNVLATAYRDLARKTQSTVAPVGQAFVMCHEQHPEISLLMSVTDSHPSPAGAYLIACVFYTHLLDKPVSGNSFFATLPPEQAKTLQAIADAVWEINIPGKKRGKTKKTTN